MPETGKEVALSCPFGKANCVRCHVRRNFPRWARDSVCQLSPDVSSLVQKILGTIHPPKTWLLLKGSTCNLESRAGVLSKEA
eukprot:3482156-Amphidinium_carterae.1